MELMETDIDATSELAKAKDDLRAALIENEVLQTHIHDLQTMNEQIKSRLHNLQGLVDTVKSFTNDVLNDCNL